MQEAKINSLNLKMLMINIQVWCGLLIEEHISFSILDAGLRDLCHTLVVKFIPQIVRIIPAVGYVVSTWDQTGE